MKQLFLTILTTLFLFQGFSQDLMDLLDDEPKVIYSEAAFKASRIVLGQSIENPKNGALTFVISHHFGRINEGWYEFFGLDQANIRLGLEYGITDWLAIGIGRTSVQKMFDGSLKVKILRQSTGKRRMPISISYFGDIGITSLKWSEPERENYFSSRMSYAHQILIARKFTPAFTFQLIPTFIHRNLVETKEEENDVWSIGAGGRIKVSPRVSINAEYYYVLPGYTADNFHDSFSFGVDIETGGHVFQVFLTNSQGLIEQQFIAQTDGDWLNGDIHIGFNIHRTFQLKKDKKPE